MNRLHLLIFITVMYPIYTDIPLPQYAIDNPMIIVPTHCQTVRMQSFSSIALVPNTDDNDMEWVLFVRHDNSIWYYNIPPTPYNTIKQYKATKITKSEYFSTLLFEVNDIETIPSFIHLSIASINKHTQQRNESLDAASIVIRITNLSQQKESETLYDLHRNAQVRANRLKNESLSLHQGYDHTSKQYNSLTASDTLVSLSKQWNDEYLTDSFKNAIVHNNFDSVLHSKDSDFIFKATNIFTSAFLNGMLIEIKRANELIQSGEIEFFRPNSMNSDGFVLAELGFLHFFDEFTKRWLSKITSSIYPFYLWGGQSIDGLHGFIIRYVDNDGMDKNLSRHMDESQITFNLCLYNDDLVGSKIWFHGIRDDDEHTQFENVSIALQQNEAILHVGQHWHQPENIQNGTRINLILWLRSSFVKSSVSQYALRECPDFVSSDFLRSGEHLEL